MVGEIKIIKYIGLLYVRLLDINFNCRQFGDASKLLNLDSLFYLKLDKN